MGCTDEKLKQFYSAFGQNGGDHLPGNVGAGRTIFTLCQEIMKACSCEDAPELYDYFVKWDQRQDGRNPYGVEQWLLGSGQWEGAWALAQLHYDQLLKYEARSGDRVHKGHPLCSLALVGRTINSPTLIRQYAMLSSAGDVYWEHEIPHLQHGGFAPTILEQYESHNEQFRWREKVRQILASIADKPPLYLEQFLARRWFSDAHLQHLSNLEYVRKCGGKPFVEVLLDAVENPTGVTSTATGVRFEAASGLLLSSTPGFEVDAARKTTDEQVDLVIRYTPEPWASIGLEQGCGLVECKSSKGPVTSAELRNFGAKCSFHRVHFGILFARAGTTGGRERFKEPGEAELVRRRFLLDGLTILVLDMSQMRDRCRELRGLADELARDYRELVFGPKAYLDDN